MTKDEAIKALKALEGIGDIQGAHEQADDILLRFLRENGYEDVADAWNAVEDSLNGGFWYS